MKDILGKTKPESDEKPIETIDINLDAHPTTRWDRVSQSYKNQLIASKEIVLARIPWILKKFFWIVATVMEAKAPANYELGEISAERFLEFKGIAEALDIPTFVHFIPK